MPPRRAITEPGRRSVNNIRPTRNNKNSPFPGRAGPSTSTATQNNNNTKKNLIQNYIIKRNVSNNNSIENLKESINLLSNILRLKNLEISSKKELEEYVKTTFSFNNLQYKRLVLQYILSIKDIIENKKINLISKVLFLLDYINISDLGKYNEQLQYVKKSKKNLLKFTSQFIMRRLKKSSIKRPIIQNILRTKIEKQPKYNNINNSKIRKIYNETKRPNYRNIGRVLNINIKADEFYLLLAKDMIHDMKKIYVDKFHLLFSDIINNILKIKFNNDENEKLKTNLKNYTSKEQKTKFLYYSSDRNLEQEISKELLGELDNKVNQGKGFKIEVGGISSKLTDGVSKNLVAYRFKGSRKKYYKKFDILINSNSQSYNITRFIHGLYKRNNKTPIATQLLTVSQMFNKGLPFVYHPAKRFYEFLRRENIGKEHGMNEKGINVNINLINNNNKSIGNFKISHEYDINNKKFYMLIDDNKINVTTASKSKNGARQALGKFMGDFNMILKVIQENKQSSDFVMAFGTADKHAASIFIKLSKILCMEPRLFFIKQTSSRPNIAMTTYPTLYIIGMNDIISERITKKTKKNLDSFKRQRVKSTQHYKKAILPPNAPNYTYVSGSNNNSNNNFNNNNNNNNNNNIKINNNLIQFLQNEMGAPEKTKTKSPKSPKSPNTSPSSQLVRKPKKDPLKGLKNAFARRMGRSPKK